MTQTQEHPHPDESLLPLPQRSGSARAPRTGTLRAAAPTAISLEQVSNMLWAGFGLNRRGSGGRAVPSCRGVREVEAYVCLPDGCYRYDACDHALVLVSAHDARPWTGSRGTEPGPAIALVYVTGAGDEADTWEETGHIPGADVATVAGKVAACSTASGLVARGEEWFHPQLAHLLGLRARQRIALTQTVTASPKPSH
ncbi:hypothetical protein JJB11_00320 [Ramlibacter ginsenosidimutans]|uniref:Nitroreductase n=1 Tax=Ramlibacter ginsenosidimutans TaxID=502333 RepID=A0A934WKM8_9BURK|nr:hypothetical protein [Ramlibacter ginsenosidimutans]MBK6004518.1 hypothetical protein [Ramlibacter ginsenosidimutans]